MNPNMNVVTMKQGNVKKCPACGSDWVSGEVKCSCGYLLTETSANSSSQELDKRLREAKRNRHATIIRNFPIPNSREDLIEFLAALEPKSKIGFISHFKEDDINKKITKAYREKFNECLNKAKISFPTDSTIQNFVIYVKKQRNKIYVLWGIVAAIAVAALVIGIVAISSYKADRDKAISQFHQEVEAYSTQLCDELDALPVPTASNYKECMRLFSSINWNKNFEWPFMGDSPLSKDEMMDGFRKKKNAYAILIGQAMKEAGIKSYDIPHEFESPDFWGDWNK